MSAKRKIEIFSAGCATCDEAVAMVKRVACSSCDVEVLDMRDPAVAAKAKSYGVRSPLTGVLLAVAVVGLGLQAKTKGYGPSVLGLFSVAAILRLEQAITRFLANWNENAQPFRWSKPAHQIKRRSAMLHLFTKRDTVGIGESQRKFRLSPSFRDANAATIAEVPSWQSLV
jgi:hypothetical protein